MVKKVILVMMVWLSPCAFAGQAAQDRASTRSPHGALAVPCQQCHTSLGWKPIRAVPDFDHRKTAYPLRGMHVSVACTQCHAKQVFTDTGHQCADCHADIHRGQMGSKCESCHSVKGWQVSIQDVKQHQNRFPLVGAHAAATCDSCHKGAATGQFVGLSTTCVSCHLADYNKTNNPSHTTIGYSTDCQSCHSMDSWLGAHFDHLKFTGFALTGAHARLECSACHANNRFTGARSNCVSCHLADFNATRNPNHVTAGFSQECSTCHSTTSWLDATFNHNTMTRFALTGAHASVQCAQCHVGGKFAGTPTQCVACHLTNFQQTTNPNHAVSGIPQTCEQCHNTTSWGNANFDHAKTVFPLTGAHVTVQCTQCHVNGQYKGTPTQCVACHLPNFQKTTNPNHVTAGFPQTCEQCHNTSSWLNAQFDHSKTAFPLTGAHVTVQCSQCHVNGVFKGTPTQCVACHLSNFQKTTNPNHVTGGFPQTCEQCHNTASWQPSTFNHNTQTKFPLTGAHVGLACTQCHANGRFVGTPTDCFSCHSSTFKTTTNPNHVTAGFPTDCSLCHSTANWLSATFDHSKTLFPLTGAHVGLSCNSCHASGVFVGLSTACVSCHLANFQKTTSPNHVTSGFPTDCQVCHTTSAWVPSVFDHSKTVFPLTGAHLSVACANCHVGGRYAGTPTDCYSCHKTAYQTVTNPNHVAAAFPTTCQTCHNTTAWTGATFTHTGFPIYSGAHQGKWTTCADCHTNSANYAVFTCVSCHAHDKTVMDPKHSGVRNYVYNSTNCYSCHRNGSAG
ncbi:MAG: hypothetical protein LAP21_28630 [Acidobacteriia bacterium]|nr:hypothetical protein [Terriglobia bacterium]